jgi:hypothetical protein
MTTPTTSPEGVELSRPHETTDWWRDAVVYQVYPRSFADGDGDGIGDLPGITSRLDHLADLGVDALWLSPFYRSPQKDAGYDVADYRDVDPRFGTIADAEAMIDRAHALGLKVIVDLVPNHTSDQHDWFRAALAAGPGSPERDRYIFRPGRGTNGELPPNDWGSVFGGIAWTRVSERADAPGSAWERDGEWYLHLFDTSQPDVDWSNPEVRTEFESILRFWLDRGVDGFRVDVAHGLVKADGLPDWQWHSEMVSGSAVDPESVPPAPMWDQDGVHEIYRSWRAILDTYSPDRVLVAEAWVDTDERLANYVRPDEMHQAFNFHFLVTPWSAGELRTAIARSLAATDTRAAWAWRRPGRVRTASSPATRSRTPTSVSPAPARSRCSCSPCPGPPTSTRARSSGSPSTPRYRTRSARIPRSRARRARRPAATAAVCRSRGSPTPPPTASPPRAGAGCRSPTRTASSHPTASAASRGPPSRCTGRRCVFAVSSDSAAPASPSCRSRTRASSP